MTFLDQINLAIEKINNEISCEVELKNKTLFKIDILESDISDLEYEIYEIDRKYEGLQKSLKDLNEVKNEELKNIERNVIVKQCFLCKS